MKRAFALALDIGTSSVRASLYDDEGNELDGTIVNLEREFQTSSNGGAEIDANEAIQQVERTIDDVLARLSPFAPQLEVVAIACFWHSLVGVDEDGNPATPVFGWADTRAAQMVDVLRRSLDENETHARTGCRFHPSYWPAKLLWLSRNPANSFRPTTRWMSLSEFLMMRFFGNTVISVSMASGTGLLNQRSCTWDEALVSFIDLDEDQLPKVAEDGEFYSGLVSEYTARWPQLNNSRWYPAIGDGAANNIGAGCVTRDRAALMIGTSGAMRVMSKGDVPDAIPFELWCYRVDKKRVLLGGALSDGGGLFQWMKTTLNFTGDDDVVERELGEMQPDEHGLTLLPFWAGERSSGWHSSARGAIIGLTQDTRPVEILRASMEAIAYRFAGIALSLAEMAPQIAIVGSGGALNSSPVWAQIIADVLARTVTLSSTREASSRGAVLLALEMEGRIRDIDDVPAPTGHTYEPDMAHHSRYREGRERQMELYGKLIN